MGRRAFRLSFAAVLAALGIGAVSALPLVSAANADVTGPIGPFGFITKGLGKTPDYGEPSLAIAPDGRHVISSTPGGGGVQYWYSANDGGSWTHTSTKCGGGDSALDFLPDETAVSADLNFPGSTGNPADSCVSLSKDYGKSWGPQARAGIEQDRQWLAHMPDGKHLMLVYHDFVAEAEFIAQSFDGGLTWTNEPQNQILVNQVNQGTALPILAGGHQGNTASIIDQGVNTFSGPLVVTPNGDDWYVFYSISDAQSNLNPQQGVPPFGPTRAVVVAHSSDQGATWTNVLADVPENPGTSSESAEGAIFPWGFIDQRGVVYTVFNSTRGAPGDSFHQYYAFSHDKGKTWSNPIKIDKLPVGTGAAVYAAGAGGAPGTIDVAWYQSDTTTPSQSNGTWVPHVAQVTGADTAHPVISEQAITTIPNHKGGICLQGILCGIGPGSADRSLLDFFQIQINKRTGMMEIAYADNNRLGGGNGEVVFAQQTSGPPSVEPQVEAATGQAPSGPAVNPGAQLPGTAGGRLGLALLAALAAGIAIVLGWRRRPVS